MFKRIFIYVFFALCLMILTVSANATTYFTANLTETQEVKPSGSTATGFARITLNETENQITVSAYFGNPNLLESNLTGGHIHSAGRGNEGPVLFDLALPVGSKTGSVINNVFPVSSQQIEDLKGGLWYLNIHTEAFPSGEIRGQFQVDSPFIAYLDNNQQVPPTAEFTGKGSAFVSLNEATAQAIVTFSWTGLSTAFDRAQINAGRVGTNGAVVCTFRAPMKRSGSIVDTLCSLDRNQVKALKAGQLYLSIYDGLDSNGAIRGQIQRRAGAVCDYDGDGKTDAAIIRPNFPAMEWWIRNSSDGSASAYTFGTYADFFAKHPVCGDFDGDGRDDLALWRSADAPNAFFYILQSDSLTVREVQFGTTGDDPRIVEDYDGDGVTDVAVFRRSDGNWYYLGSSNNPNNNLTVVRWGTNYAVPGDYDGDGKGDFVDHQGASWWILNSLDSNVKVISFGPDLCLGSPGDYDGDGKVDIAVTNIENSHYTWYYQSSVSPQQNPYLTRNELGKFADDTPAPVTAQGDYDGDGKTDYAVYIQTQTPGDNSKFWILPSNGGGTIVIPWGKYNSNQAFFDYPVANYNRR